MSSSYSATYKAAGVDITAGYKAVELIKKHVERTRIPGFLGGLGGFGGLFAPDLGGIAEPVLVSGADGVGTKLRLAFLLDKHTTVGIDCVAMCVNDIICSLARPLFFLDYIACGRNTPEKIAAIVEGAAEGCVRAGCALIGGETAEMPGFYGENEYDLAGFAVGLTGKPDIPNPAAIQAGDAVIALPSSGLHSNGFSLIRKIFNLDDEREAARILGRPAPEFSGSPAAASGGGGPAAAAAAGGEGSPAAASGGGSGTLGEALLTPTRIYAKPVLSLAAKLKPRGLAHITGGGFYENMPRCLPEGKRLRLSRRALRIPAIFSYIQEKAAETGVYAMAERDMFNTFNMGVGMILIMRAQDAAAALDILGETGEEAYIIGEVEDGERGVLIEN